MVHYYTLGKMNGGFTRKTKCGSCAYKKVQWDGPFEYLLLSGELRDAGRKRLELSRGYPLPAILDLLPEELRPLVFRPEMTRQHQPRKQNSGNK